MEVVKSNLLKVRLGGTQFYFEAPNLPENLSNLTGKEHRYLDKLGKAITRWYKEKPRVPPSNGTLVLCKQGSEYFVALQKEMF